MPKSQVLELGIGYSYRLSAEFRFPASPTSLSLTPRSSPTCEMPGLFPEKLKLESITQKKRDVHKISPAILGPETAAPILWAPGIFGFFLLEKPHAHKIPPFMGVGIFPNYRCRMSHLIPGEL